MSGFMAKEREVYSLHLEQILHGCHILISTIATDDDHENNFYQISRVLKSRANRAKCLRMIWIQFGGIAFILISHTDGDIIGSIWRSVDPLH
jgi:hypothetical protein